MERKAFGKRLFIDKASFTFEGHVRSEMDTPNEPNSGGVSSLKGAGRAKRTQLGPGQDERQVPCRKRIMADRAWKRGWKNEANSPPPVLSRPAADWLRFA